MSCNVNSKYLIRTVHGFSANVLKDVKKFYSLHMFMSNVLTLTLDSLFGAGVKEIY